MTWGINWPAWSERKKAVYNASTQWIGETSIGLIPLLAHIITTRYSAPRFQAFLCDPTANAPTNCSALSTNAAQEICIITVVVAGLAVLSTLRLGPAPRKAEDTPFTYGLTVLAILSLLFGALLYELYGAHLARDAENVTYAFLIMALVSSFSLTLEGAILEA